jgi:uncharacterized membrane protein
MYELLLLGVMSLYIASDFLDRRVTAGGNPTTRDSISLWSVVVQFLLICPLVGLLGPIAAWPLALCALIGIVSSLGRISWYHALASGESLSRLAPFTRISSIIVIVGAYVLLGDRPSYEKLGGGLLMIIGSLLISIERSADAIRQFFTADRAVLLTLAFAASMASVTLLYKYLLNYGVEIFTTFFYLRAFQFCITVPLILQRPRFDANLRRVSGLKVVVFARILQTVGTLTFLFVLSKLNLTTAEPIAALNPVLVWGVELVMGRSSKPADTHKESQAPGAEKKLIYIRMVALAIIAIGLLLLSGWG